MMSNKNKTNWFMLVVFVVLVACMGYLVALSFVRSGTANQGLQCVQNCEGYNVLLEQLNQSEGLGVGLAGSIGSGLQPTEPVQKTGKVQLTASVKAPNSSDKLEF